MKLLDSAPFLLLATGTFLGMILPLGKIATAAGISPQLWTFLISASAGAILTLVMLLRGKSIGFTRSKLRYYFITAVVSQAIPNLLILSAIPRLGAGFTGIMYTMSPVLTLLFSLALGLRRPNRLGIVGILVGFLGALIVALTRGEVGKPGDPLWIGLALLIPVFLAIGNVYRTIDWPPGADPTELAAGTHLATALVLVIGIYGITGELPLHEFARAPWAAVIQAICSAGMFALFFRLQAVGGPVYLSQMGYVAAAIGLVSGTWLLGEHYTLLTWLGAMVICAGVAMTSRAQSH